MANLKDGHHCATVSTPVLHSQLPIIGLASEAMAEDEAVIGENDLRIADMLFLISVLARPLSAKRNEKSNLGHHSLLQDCFLASDRMWFVSEGSKSLSKTNQYPQSM